MKVLLMYRDRDLDLGQPSPPNETDLTQDLELNTLLNAMAARDDLVLLVARKAIFLSLNDPDEIRYRQEILNDCLNNPSVVRNLYQLPIEAGENKRKHWLGIFSRSPGGILSGAVEMLQMYVGLLRKLKNIADEHAGQFASEGFRRFFDMLKKELNDEYFALVEEHLQELHFRDGVLLSIELGMGNEGTHHTLRKPNKKSWIERIINRSPVYTFSIPPRDEHGARALGNLRDRGINLVANALAQSAEHIDSFFNVLRIELAFYIGCLNLYERLNELEEPTTWPVPLPADERRHSFKGLYDVCLALTMKRQVVGNDISADGKDLFIVTGANQGGKSTFLRSIGLAQLMMQAGMFVPAESFCANVCSGLFTHYKREEDKTMTSGKLDEELVRISDIVDHLTPNALVLFNESFAATNEREGSEIARQIVTALLEKQIKVFFVTHQYEFAYSFYSKKPANALFLRAPRESGGKRTYKLIKGEPLQTSFGKDLYYRTFGDN